MDISIFLSISITHTRNATIKHTNTAPQLFLSYKMYILLINKQKLSSSVPSYSPTPSLCSCLHPYATCDAHSSYSLSYSISAPFSTAVSSCSAHFYSILIVKRFLKNVSTDSNQDSALNFWFPEELFVVDWLFC